MNLKQVYDHCLKKGIDPEKVTFWHGWKEVFALVDRNAIPGVELLPPSELEDQQVDFGNRYNTAYYYEKYGVWYYTEFEAYCIKVA